MADSHLDVAGLGYARLDVYGLICLDMGDQDLALLVRPDWLVEYGWIDILVMADIWALLDVAGLGTLSMVAQN